MSSATPLLLAMHGFDLVVVLWVLLVVLAVAFAFRKRASSGVDDFFLSGRKLSWWMLGTSMVATTFAADTPLAVTGLVHSSGIGGNWLWWCFVFGTTATVYFFADSWRRARITSDIELCDLRYGGASGNALRAVRALYMSFVYVGIILGWVFDAMATVLRVALELDVSQQQYVLYALSGLALLYTLLSGLWGVVATDVLQFVLAMGGSIVLAVFAWTDFGGAAGLQASLSESFGSEQAEKILSFLPTDFGGFASMGAGWLVWVLAVQWWAVVYPGMEPGGGSFVAQRMLAARSVDDARRGTLLYAIAHYALRPWPWILVALWTLVSLDLGDDPARIKEAYAVAMQRLLPPGLFGLLLASFFAAFMSTVDTLLTLTGSYLVNDLYRPFLARERSERHYIAASRVAIVLVLATGILVSRELGAGGIDDAWRLLFAIGAGSGSVLALRWFWWRINAWSEIAAMFGAFVAASAFDPTMRRILGLEEVLPGLQIDVGVKDSAPRMFAIVGATTLVWLVVTFVTKASDGARLERFYRRVRPSGAWGPVARRCPDVEVAPQLASATLAWLASTALVLSCLFAIGEMLFGAPWSWAAWAGCALFCALLLWGLERDEPA